jgi:hypothetical protein
MVLMRRKNECRRDRDYRCLLCYFTSSCCCSLAFPSFILGFVIHHSSFITHHSSFIIHHPSQQYVHLFVYNSGNREEEEKEGSSIYLQYVHAELSLANSLTTATGLLPTDSTRSRTTCRHKAEPSISQIDAHTATIYNMYMPSYAITHSNSHISSTATSYISVATGRHKADPSIS